MINTDLIHYSKFFINSSKDIEGEWLNVSTDTRSFENGSIFIAITGENFNAVEHLAILKGRNCPIIIYEKNEINDLTINQLKSDINSNFVAVKDCIKFIQDLANKQIKAFKQAGGKVVSISGSNGKTTTKEMLTHLLSSVYPDGVVSTEKNLNNYLGVPFTIFNLEKDTKFLILELGSNAPGEIEELVKIAEPDFSLTTNIGETHLEFFPNFVEGVFIEESSTYAWIKDHGTKFFLNLDDEFLNTLEVDDKVITYGEHENAQFRFDLVDSQLVINDSFKVKNTNITGHFNYINLGISLIIAKFLTDKELSDFSDSAASYKPGLLRSEWVKKFDSKFFLDTYNANPSSMKHSIKAFLEFAETSNTDISKLLFIVGDMNELGSYTGLAHRELSASLTDHQSIYIGKFSQYFDASIGKFDNTQDFLKNYSTDNFKDYDLIFIKASRSLQLEQILGITY